MGSNIDKTTQDRTPLTAPTKSPGHNMPMPLQKVTLFRKAMDGVAQNRSMGIGIECETDPYTGHIVIQTVHVGGAAHNSGQVFLADTLLQVNGSSVTGMSPELVQQMLSGEAGTPVSILVSHNPEKLQLASGMALPGIVKPSPSRALPPKPDPGFSAAEQEAEERRMAREKVRKQLFFSQGSRPQRSDYADDIHFIFAISILT